MLSDDFRDGSRLYPGLCSGFILDPRRLVCPSRSKGTTYFSETFASLAAIGGSVSGTGERTQLAPGQGGTANPANAYGVRLSSGSALASAAWLAWKIPALPKSYGITVLHEMIANSGEDADALWTHFQNTENGAAVMLEFKLWGIHAVDKYGARHKVSHHCPPYICESWFEVKDNADGTVTVQVYQGTQKSAPAVTFEPPIGNRLNDGLIMAKQSGDAHAGQVSAIYQMGIGETQLADDMLVAWSPRSAPFDATALNALFQVEDVALELDVGLDLWADVQLGNGAFLPMVMTEVTFAGAPWLGIVDKTKPVRLVRGSLAAAIPQGTPITPRVRIVNRTFAAITGAHFQLTSNE